MKYLCVILLLALSSFAPKDDAVTVLRKMYNRYHGHWHTTLKFTQQTERYRNDSLISKETWYETMAYPKLFRIDFGEPALGNCVIFRNDSAYIFKNSKLAKSRVDSNELLFLLGGMYFASSFNDVVARFGAMQYDLKKSHTAKWKGKEVYVLGATNDAEQVNQLWVEKEHFNVVRFVKYENGVKEDAVFEDHTRLGKHGWCETNVTFYRNGQLLQKEKYTDLIANDSVSSAIFSPATPWQYHWRK